MNEERYKIRKQLLRLWRLGAAEWGDVWKTLYNLGFRGKELNHGFLPKPQ
jgi:hypothetical protein